MQDHYERHLGMKCDFYLRGSYQNVTNMRGDEDDVV